MIYNFYTEFANAEEFTKINRSAEWKDMCKKINKYTEDYLARCGLLS